MIKRESKSQGLVVKTPVLGNPIHFKRHNRDNWMNVTEKHYGCSRESSGFVRGMYKMT